MNKDDVFNKAADEIPGDTILGDLSAEDREALGYTYMPKAVVSPWLLFQASVTSKRALKMTVAQFKAWATI